MTQVLIDGMPWKLERLIDRLEGCSPDKQVIFGPGYLGPKLEFYPTRFMSDGVHLSFGCFSQDHHKEMRLRKYLVPLVTVGTYLNFLRTIAGQEKMGWKGDHYLFDNNFHCFVGLPGEVGMGVYGIHEGIDVSFILAAR